MKKHLLSLIALILISCQNNKKFQISGIVDYSKDSIIKLHYKENDSIKIINTIIHDGKFEFSGKVNEPIISFLKLDNGIPGQILLENGSKSNIKIEDREFSINSDSEKIELVQNYNSISNRNQKIKDSILQIIVAKYSEDTFVQSLVKDWLYFTDPDFEKQDQIMNLVQTKNNISTYLESALDIFERNKTNNIGVIIPNLEFPNEVMIKENLINKDSEYTLIDFGASWCIPCTRKNQTLVKFYDKIKEHGIRITSVSIDKNISDWKKSNEMQQIPWRNLIDSTSVSMDRFKYQTIPYGILVDKQGRIVHSNYKLTDIQNLLIQE